MRLVLDRRAELKSLSDRRVCVLDLEVDLPRRGHLRGPVDGRVHDAGERALPLAEGRVAEGRLVAHTVRVPAERLAVEVDRAAVGVRVQLEPGGRAVLAADLEPLNIAGLPDSDRGVAGVADDGHAPVLGDVHRLDVDLAAVRLHGPDGAIGVVGRKVDRPGVGHALLAVVGHAAGDNLPVLLEEEVAAVVRAGIHRRPAEQPAVEVLGPLGVGAVEVDPARSASDECGCGHDACLL